jgi:ankyrin repeat protein
LYFRGADVNFIRVDKATDGRAVMHEAAERGSVDMLKWLVSKKGNINILSTVRKSTPLMLAAAGGHIDAMMYLLGQGAVAHVNDIDNKGMTALHYSAIFGAPEHADVLMICGADKGIRSKLNRLPLEEAKARNRPEMVIKIQLYKPPFSMRQERMAYFEKIYRNDDADDDVDGTVNTGSVTAAEE